MGTTFTFTLWTFNFFHFLFFPDAVVDHFTFLGPVFFEASFLLIFPAIAFGLQAG
jgi:hypothetical protein